MKFKSLSASHCAWANTARLSSVRATSTPGTVAPKGTSPVPSLKRSDSLRNQAAPAVSCKVSVARQSA